MTLIEDSLEGVKASILVPWTLGEKSGWATLGTVVNGWNSFDDNTKVTKTFYENTTETVTIPVLSCDDYDYSEMYIDVNVNVDQINYKKVVKGISEDSRCLYAYNDYCNYCSCCDYHYCYCYLFHHSFN